MIYPKNQQQELSESLFQNPTSEYRGTPFWAWNCKLDKAELEWQIEVFKKMGLGGFHMHVRTGLDTEYLSDEYMQMVKACVNKAEKEEMLAWLYDEDRWPSGAAGGIVTKDVRFRKRHLMLSPEPKEGLTLLACYEVQLREDGFLSSYRKIQENQAVQGDKWYVYLVIDGNDSWYNGQAYADTLNKKAIEQFIYVTHETYKREIADRFGKSVPAIFTDEPQFDRKRVLNNSRDRMCVNLPWTDDIPQTYHEQYGCDIFETLPELFWELPDGKISLARYRYHDHIAERFAESFADTCGKWCEENGIALTGHLMEEPTLHSQTAALGDAMRSYRGFQLPGIDMLCARFEYTTAKQAQSAAHQFGREGVLSELYGVTGWEYDFRGYKLHGDWQAALGVTVRVPHLSWVSMQGAAKRDYPASISYQSPWYEKFPVVEDHFGRVNTAMTRGKPIVKLGVIHPVESFWLHWGPNDKTALMRNSLDERFQNLTDWLVKGSIDFDFVSESLLPLLCQKGDDPFQVGQMQYDTILVPGCETLRSSTLERLEAFSEKGGKLIFMGDAPLYENAVCSERGKVLYQKSIKIGYDRAALLTVLDENRTITLRRADGSLTDNLTYQLRQDHNCQWLFIAHCVEPYNKQITRKEDINLFIKGKVTPVLYDTLNGEIKDLPFTYQNGQTVVPFTLYAYDSLLLCLKPTAGVGCAEKTELKAQKPVRIPETVCYTLSEKNVLLLDMAETSVDGQPFLEKEELLRADNIWRARFEMSNRSGHCVQPWVLPKQEPDKKLTMRFRFESQIEVQNALLALEEPENADIVCNGQTVEKKILGYFTDKAIKTVALPTIVKGENELLITIPFGIRSNTEWCYILGDFGVELWGTGAVLTELPKTVSFFDLSRQPFPFYSGNITYHIPLTTKQGDLSVALPHFASPINSVALDGVQQGDIAFMPYTLRFPVEEGEHQLDVTAYGHRFNSFGAVHHADVNERWHGPGAWESRDSAWQYEYQLRQFGLLSAPVITQGE